MLDSAKYRERRYGERYYTSIERTMSDHSSTEGNVTGISSEKVKGEVSDFQTLTQEAVNEQIRGLIASVTCQLDELIRLVQRMVTTQHPDHYPRTDFGTTSGFWHHHTSIRQPWFRRLVSFSIIRLNFEVG